MEYEVILTVAVIGGGAVISIIIYSQFYETIIARRRNLAILSDIILAAAEKNLPLVQAMAVVSEDAKGFFRARLASAVSLAKDGMNLGKALRLQKGYFPDTMCNMIEAGVRYGNLRALAQHLRKDYMKAVSLRERLVTSLIYPVFLFFSAFAIVTVIMVVVLPQFKKMFQELEIVLPWVTQALFAVMTFLLGSWYIIVLLGPLAVGFVVALVLFGATWGTAARRKVPALALLVDTVFSRIPWLGAIIMRASYSQFARAVGGLVNAGMPLVDAVGAVLQADFNHIAKNRLTEAHRMMQDGSRFGDALRTVGAPEELCWFAEAGEGSAHLADHMRRVADLYQSGIESAMGELSRVVVPLITVPMGLAVGFIALALWTPLMEITTLF